MEFFSLNMNNEIAAANNVKTGADAAGNAGGGEGSWVERLFTQMGNWCGVGGQHYNDWAHHSTGTFQCNYRKKHGLLHAD